MTTLSPTDAWAVGIYGSTGKATSYALALHWNGTTWSQTPVPVPGHGSELRAVDALSPDDVWAVGDYETPSNLDHVVILHWNGTSWTRVATPNPGGSGLSDETTLNGVSEVSSTDAWAVGLYGHGGARAGVRKTMLLHWDGTDWTQVTGPSTGDESWLNGVVALSPTDAWAVGGTSIGGGTGDTVVMHWNGTNWTRS